MTEGKPAMIARERESLSPPRGSGEVRVDYSLTIEKEACRIRVIRVKGLFTQYIIVRQTLDPKHRSSRNVPEERPKRCQICQPRAEKERH